MTFLFLTCEFGARDAGTTLKLGGGGERLLGSKVTPTQNSPPQRLPTGPALAPAESGSATALLVDKLFFQKVNIFYANLLPLCASPHPHPVGCY